MWKRLSGLLSVVKILRAGVGAAVGNAAAAGVADGYLADRALVAGDGQHLHLGGVAGMSAMAICTRWVTMARSL